MVHKTKNYMKSKIITDIRKYLIDENIYTEKDEITLLLLENTYAQYQEAVKEVKKNGQTLIINDSSNNRKIVKNPSFSNQLELQKELFKLIDSLYLSPKSRKTKKDTTEEKENPFQTMIKDLVEKR